MADDPGNNGSSRAGIVRTVAQVLSRLSPEFLGLLIVDCIFLLSVVWLFERQNAARERVMGPTLQACVSNVPMEAFRLAQQQPPQLTPPPDRNVCEAIENVHNDLRDIRHQLDALRPPIEAVTRQTTNARLKGPER